MKNSTKISFIVLLIVAIGLYTVNGIKPEIKKTMVYKDSNKLIEDYFKGMADIQHEYQSAMNYNEMESRCKVRAVKFAETISQRSRYILTNSIERRNYSLDGIMPKYYDYLYNVSLSNELYTGKYTVSKIEPEKYTAIIKEMITTYNDSFINIPNYERGKNPDVYRVDLTTSEDNSKISYVIYLIIVDEGEGLVVDDMKIIRVGAE